MNFLRIVVVRGRISATWTLKRILPSKQDIQKVSAKLGMFELQLMLDDGRQSRKRQFRLIVSLHLRQLLEEIADVNDARFVWNVASVDRGQVVVVVIVSVDGILTV